MTQKEITMTEENEGLPATKGDLNWLARLVVNTMASKEDLFTVENKVDNLGYKVDKLGGKVDLLEMNVSHLEGRIGGLEVKFVGLESKVDDISEKMNELSTKGQIDKLITKEDKIISMLEKRTAEEAATTIKMDRFQETLDDYGKRIRSIEGSKIS